MINQNRLLIIILIFCFIAIVISYITSFPVILDNNSKTITGFNPLFWLALSISFFSILLLGKNLQRKFFLLVLAIYFVFLFTSPSFFFWIHGMDTAGSFGGLLHYTIDHNLQDLSAKDYYQWPIFFILALIIAKTSQVPVAFLISILMSLIILVFSSNLFLYSSSKGYNNPLFSVMLFFMVFYIFLNWQVGPQTYAFCLFLLGLNLLRLDNRFLFLLIPTFIALVFSHAFVSVWFIFLVIIMTIFSLNSNWKKYFNISLLLILIQIIAVMFFSVLYFKDILSVIFHNYSTILSEESLSHQEILTYSIQALNSSNQLILDNLVRHIAQFNAILLAFVLMISTILATIQKQITIKDISLFLSGGIYFVIGFFINILGIRGLQVSAIAVSGTFNLSLFKKYSKVVFFILILISLLFPANLIRIYGEDTHYTVNEENSGFSFYLNKINPKDNFILITSGVDGNYLSNINEKINFINTRSNDFNTIQNYHTILYNKKFEKEVNSTKRYQEFQEKYLNSNSDIIVIYNNEIQKIYLKA